MSMEALAWAAKQRITPVGRKYVLSTLADRANGDGECWPTVASICEVTGLKERMVRYHLTALADAGYIQTQNQGRYPNLYRLALSGNPLPVNERNALPVNEIDNRQSIAPISESLTGNPLHLNRQSIAVTSLLTQKNPKKDSLRTRPQTRTRDPDWLQRLSLPAWANLSATHIAELESQAQKLGIDIAAESLACDDWMKANKRSVKAPYATLKNWLDKAAQIKGERVGNSRPNSQTGHSKPAANGERRGGWSTAIATRGRQTGVA